MLAPPVGVVAGCRFGGGDADLVEQCEGIGPLETRQEAGDRSGHGVHLGSGDRLSPVDRPLTERHTLETRERKTASLRHTMPRRSSSPSVVSAYPWRFQETGRRHHARRGIVR